MGYYSDIDSGELDEGTFADKSRSKAVRQNNPETHCSSHSPLAKVPSNSNWESGADGKRPLGKYTREECVRGAINRAAKARAVIHDLIEENLPLAIALRNQDTSTYQDVKLKFVMSQFVRDYLPLKNAKAAVRHYGAFIKAKLKYYENSLPVMNLGNLIDKLRLAYAKSKNKPVKPPLFASMKGVITRLSSNVFKTSCKKEGGGWVLKLGMWCYFTDTETGECFAGTD